MGFQPEGPPPDSWKPRETQGFLQQILSFPGNLHISWVVRKTGRAGEPTLQSGEIRVVDFTQWEKTALQAGAFVFHDPRGKRWHRWRLLIITAVSLGFAGILFFAYSLIQTADREPVSAAWWASTDLREVKVGARDGRGNTKAFLWKKYLKILKPTRKPSPKSPSSAAGHAGSATPRKTFSFYPIRMGYTAPWDDSSFQSLREHHSQLTHVCTEWLTIGDSLETLKVRPDFRVQEFAAAHGLGLMLLLNNWEEGTWQPEGVEALANGPASRRDRFIGEVITAAKQAAAKGVVVDWGQLDPAYRDRIASLLLEMARRFHEHALELWLSVPMGRELKAFDLKSLAGGLDRFIAVVHDEHGEEDEPGPIASTPWVEGWLQVVTAFGRPDQWILEFGSYGYEWAAGQKIAETLSFADVMARASLSGIKGSIWDDASGNPVFSYEENGARRTVWFLDAVTLWNQMRSADAYHPAGVAIYRLGTEDPGIWSVLAQGNPEPSLSAVASSLAQIHPGNTIARMGRGNFLSLHTAVEDGSRTIRVTASRRPSEVFDRFPRYVTMRARGAGRPDEVAITFDDGPDPKWTPKILDILKERGVSASFFVVGRQVEKHPELLRRIVEEGHEVGIHTYTHPDLSKVSEDRAKLEISATRCLIESVTGRTTIFFRPPYNADAFPHTREELNSVRLAQSMGYVTVAEDIDPEDWSEPGSAAILARIKQQRRMGGNVVLLHDAGGDRSQTVQALPAILDYLAHRGDRVVSMATLLNQSHDTVMPPVEAGETIPERVSVSGFRVLTVAERLFWSFVAVATVLVVVRSLLIIVFAWRHRRRETRRSARPFHPPVSVLIAAYNEAKVIGGTLEAVLQTAYPNEMEVVVVDDGSRDETAAIVAAAAERDSRIQLLRQANRGKAAALAYGLGAVRHDIVVTLDADTRFYPGTIGHLVEPFADPKVAAVSGQARVGNRRGFLAQCQALEYLCGFNLDRRAYDVLQCITVVPGAVSAWRKSAVVEAGGISGETLAEDTDLTLSLHRLGRSVVYAPQAVAWTEAPESLRGLMKQRFRWAFGTLQCLWKHRDMVFHPRYRALGLLGLPNVWFFQILLVALTPLLDFAFLMSFLFGSAKLLLIYFTAFLLMDLASAGAACAIEREPLRQAWLIVPMRFIYRPVLGWVIWRSVYKAVQGAWVRWSKVDRTAAFNYPVPGAARN